LRISRCIEFILPSLPRKFNFNFASKKAQSRPRKSQKHGGRPGGKSLEGLSEALPQTEAGPRITDRKKSLSLLGNFALLPNLSFPLARLPSRMKIRAQDY
jgi:hypothetical protein